WLASPLTGKKPDEPDTEKGRFGRMDINGAAHYNVAKRIDSTKAEELGEAMPLTQLAYTSYPSPAAAHNSEYLHDSGPAYPPRHY
ncbi:hypothetical protein IWW57_004944, partial [Coemansia sp. S610]